MEVEEALKDAYRQIDHELELFESRADLGDDWDAGYIEGMRAARRIVGDLIDEYARGPLGRRR